MSLIMIISSTPAAGTTVTRGSASPSMPARISAYMSATRRGVPFTPSRSGSSPTPAKISRTPSSILSRSMGISDFPPSGRDQMLEGRRQLLEVRQLGRSRKIARLAETIDPHGGEPELGTGRDVVEQARGDVHVPGAVRAGLGEEAVPVSVRRFVRARLGRGDAQVDRNADEGQRRVQQIRVRVGQAG